MGAQLRSIKIMEIIFLLLRDASDDGELLFFVIYSYLGTFVWYLLPSLLNKHEKLKCWYLFLLFLD